MKTVFIFIGLKLAEIIGTLLALWLLGTASLFVVEFVGFSFPLHENYFVKRFMSILFVGLFAMFSVLVFVVCYEWFSANWKKAKQLGGKF